MTAVRIGNAHRIRARRQIPCGKRIVRLYGQSEPLYIIRGNAAVHVYVHIAVFVPVTIQRYGRRAQYGGCQQRWFGNYECVMIFQLRVRIHQIQCIDTGRQAAYILLVGDLRSRFVFPREDERSMPPLDYQHYPAVVAAEAAYVRNRRPDAQVTRLVNGNAQSSGRTTVGIGYRHIIRTGYKPGLVLLVLSGCVYVSAHPIISIGFDSARYGYVD